MLIVVVVMMMMMVVVMMVVVMLLLLLLLLLTWLLLLLLLCAYPRDWRSGPIDCRGHRGGGRGVRYHHIRIGSIPSRVPGIDREGERGRLEREGIERAIG